MKASVHVLDFLGHIKGKNILCFETAITIFIQREDCQNSAASYGYTTGTNPKVGNMELWSRMAGWRRGRQFQRAAGFSSSACCSMVNFRCEEDSSRTHWSWSAAPLVCCSAVCWSDSLLVCCLLLHWSAGPLVRCLLSAALLVCCSTGLLVCCPLPRCPLPAALLLHWSATPLSTALLVCCSAGPLVCCSAALLLRWSR